MYPYLFLERTNSKSAFPPLWSAPSKMHGINPSNLSRTTPGITNARTFGGPAGSFNESTTVHHLITHLLAARPGQIAKSQGWDLIAFPTAPVTIRAEVVLVKIVSRARSQRDLPRGRRDRITGSYRRNLSSRDAADRSLQIPSILIASMCLGMYCPYSRAVTCSISGPTSGRARYGSILALFAPTRCRWGR